MSEKKKARIASIAAVVIVVIFAAFVIFTKVIHPKFPVYEPGFDIEELTAVSMVHIDGETVTAKITTDREVGQRMLDFVNGLTATGDAKYDESISDGYYIRIDLNDVTEIHMLFISPDGTVAMTGDRTYTIQKVDPKAMYDSLDLEEVDLTGQIQTTLPDYETDQGQAYDDGNQTIIYEEETGRYLDQDGNPVEYNPDEAAG